MKAEKKRLRQQIARASNEIYRRTQERKATGKEKELPKKPKKLTGGVDPTRQMLKQYKESWIDKFKYKKIKLQRLIKADK